MIQSTSHFSSRCSDSSNGTQYTPNADMYMGQFPSVQSAHIPYTGSTTYSYYPYGVLPNGTHGAAPLDAPVAPSPGVGAGVAHPAFQAGPGGCYPPPTATAPTTQHPFAPPMCHQFIPSNSFPGTTTPDPPGISHQTHLHQYHGAGLATDSPSPSLPQAPRISVGQKRVAQDLEDHNVKRTKVVKVNQPKTNIKNDPCFTPVLNRFGQHDGDYICSRDGRVIRSDYYKQHVRMGIHVHGPTVYECHLCGKTFTRRKSCRKHWDSRCGKLLVAAGGVPMSYSDACRHFKSSASASLVEKAAMAFTFRLPTTATTSDISLPESMPTEATEDSPNPDSGVAIEIQDAALVAPVLPPSEVREISLVEVHGSLDF
ncbi:hypothetical protein EDD22DRAFT_604189 [Suillus occidentalis]|nr:hypothetical protein EDD22DRAFT_604189 [Suillus occidentalis]